MDEATVRKYADDHAQAVVKGDMQHLMADVDPAALASLGGLQASMPNPVVSAEVQSVDASGPEAVVRITYTGNDKSATVESVWKDNGTRPVITKAGVV